MCQSGTGARVVFCSISLDVAQHVKLKPCISLPAPPPAWSHANNTASHFPRHQLTQRYAEMLRQNFSAELIICIQIGLIRFPEASPTELCRSPKKQLRAWRHRPAMGLGQLTQQWAMFLHDKQRSTFFLMLKSPESHICCICLGRCH